jgi:hypothetical protein
MSHDITLPIDGKLALTAEPCAYKVPKPPAKPLAPRKAVLEAQAKRHRALIADGLIVKVGMGATVFRSYGQPMRTWEGLD